MSTEKLPLSIIMHGQFHEFILLFLEVLNALSIFPNQIIDCRSRTINTAENKEIVKSARCFSHEAIGVYSREELSVPIVGAEDVVCLRTI